ncbi:CemA-like proton extrusion protein-like protein [Actinidia rufa]|uniref:CemA-like proton extrusion protein-like protein n=1 Tax=Actinidia rufa TaxID=165716 RepID=A0A7J0GEM0_9ERIC|nr:CemA-like proton extrusion protein-like protein [Actinidia rufa]
MVGEGMRLSKKDEEGLSTIGEEGSGEGAAYVEGQWGGGSAVSEKGGCGLMVVEEGGCGFFAPNAKNSHSGKRSWWKKFFFDDEGNWLGLKDEDILEEEESEGSSEEEVSEGEKFEAWKRRAEAIIELREAQADLRNQENRRWEDWLVDETNDVNSSSWDQDWNDRPGKSREDALENPSELIPERGLVKSLRDFSLGDRR